MRYCIPEFRKGINKISYLSIHPSVDPHCGDGGPGGCGDPVQGAGHHGGGHLLRARGVCRTRGK